MKRYRDALAIQKGACNPSGIALTIVEACRDIRAEPDYTGTDQIRKDPAVRLMVNQLAYLCNNSEIDNFPDVYNKLTEACEEKA